MLEAASHSKLALFFAKSCLSQTLGMFGQALVRLVPLTGPSPLEGARFCIVTLGLTNIRCVTLGIDNDLCRDLWPEKRGSKKSRTL